MLHQRSAAAGRQSGSVFEVRGDWVVGRTLVREGAAVGAQSIVVTGVTIGRWALIGAGSVVTRDVPDHALVYGQPARIQGWVCKCARRLGLVGLVRGMRCQNSSTRVMSSRTGVRGVQGE